MEEVVGVDLGVVVDGRCNLVAFGVAVEVEVELEHCMRVQFGVQDALYLAFDIAPSILCKFQDLRKRRILRIIPVLLL